MPVKQLFGHDRERIRAAMQSANLAKAAQQDNEGRSQLQANAMAVATGLATSVAGKARRLGVPIPGGDMLSQDADTINRVNQAVQGAMSQKDEELQEATGIPSWLTSGARSVASQSPEMLLAIGAGGLPGAIGLGMSNAANQQITAARDAGLNESDVAGTAARKALIEGGVTGAFSAFGGPIGGGLESMVANAFRSGGKEALKSEALKGAMKQTLLSRAAQGGLALTAEVAEELTIEGLSALEDVYAGVDPAATDPERLAETARDTIAQTVMQMGLFKGVTKAQQAYADYENRDRKQLLDAAKQVVEPDQLDQPEQDADEESQTIDDVLADLLADDTPKTQGEIVVALKEAGFDVDDPNIAADADAAIDKLIEAGYEYDPDTGQIRKGPSLTGATQSDDALRQRLLDSGFDPDLVNSLDAEALDTYVAILDRQEAEAAGIPTDEETQTDDVSEVPQTEADASQKGGDQNEEGNQEGRQGGQGLLEPESTDAPGATTTEETPSSTPLTDDTTDETKIDEEEYLDGKVDANSTPEQVEAVWRKRFPDRRRAPSKSTMLEELEASEPAQTQPPIPTSPAPVETAPETQTDAIGEETPGNLPATENIESKEPVERVQTEPDQDGEVEETEQDLDRYPLPEYVRTEQDADMVRKRLAAGKAVPVDTYEFYQDYLREQQAKQSEPKPPRLGGKKKPKPAPEPKPEPKLIGKNKSGQDVFEDENGVRTVVGDDGRETESVRMVVSDEGVKPVVNVNNRADRYKTVDELPVANYPVVKGEWRESLLGPKPGSTQQEINQRLAARLFELAKDSRQVGHATGTWFEFDATGDSATIKHYYTGTTLSVPKSELKKVKSVDDLLSLLEPPKVSQPTAEAAPTTGVTYPDMTITGQSKPIAGMESEEATYTVHRRKPDVLPDTFSVVVSGKPTGKGWTSVKGTGMTAEDAYDLAVSMFKEKRSSQPTTEATPVISDEAPVVEFQYGDAVARSDDPNYIGRYEGKNKDGDFIVKKNGSRTTWPADKTVRSDATVDDQGRAMAAEPEKVLTPDDVSVGDLMATAMEGFGNVPEQADTSSEVEPSKRIFEKKPKSISSKLQESADAARKEADALWDQLKKQTDGKFSVNPFADPELQKTAVLLVVAEVKAKSLDFAAFVAKGVERVGEERMRQLAPLLESAWTSIRNKYKFEGMTESSSIVNMLDETDEGNESFANEPEAIPAYVVSGMQKGPNDIADRRATGRPIGIAVTHIQRGKEKVSSERVIKSVAHHANRGIVVFLDSGMFGVVKNGEIGQEPNWERVFQQYDRVLQYVDEAYRSNVMIVAPDYLEKVPGAIIGDPVRTQELQERYRGKLQEYQDQGVSIIVPVQKDITGERTLSSLAADVTDIVDFGTKRVSFGIPYNAAPYSNEEILEFVEKNKGTGLRLHLLGGGKARAEKLWEQIKAIDPTVYLTGDSATEVRNRDRYPTDPEEVAKVAPEADYGTPDTPNRIELGKHFGRRLSEGAAYESILDARKEAVALVGGPIKAGTKAAKDIDEAVEQGVVRAAREIVNEGRATGTPDQIIYDRLVDLYQRQPNLNVRTSTSMMEQAYSTPAPLAWAASMIADVKATDTAFDSSAGNGMLLIASDNGYANELNPDRKMSLDAQALQFVWNQDATALSVNRKFSRITINPPFGTLKDEDGKDMSWKVGDVRTDKIDHAITLQTLETMEDDGKAFILIGGKGFEKREPKGDSERGRAYLGDKKFYDALYNNYNVTDHFTIHGDMYSRQGASFPVDVIIVDGKKPSTRPKPYNITGGGIPAVIRSWEELKDAKLRPVVSTSSADPQRDAATNAPTVEAVDEAAATQDAATVPTEPTGERVGTEDGGKPGPRRLGKPSGQSGVSNEADAERPMADQADAGQPRVDDRGQRDAKRSDRPDSGDRVTIKPDETAETAYQVKYDPGSKNKSVDTLIPRNHQSAVARSLEAVEERYGSLDKFVAKELGYSDKAFAEAFSAEQVDALALAIARHKSGEAFIIGDQTGVGKGRAAAGMMIYAKRQGLVPVFITEKPTLYADMVRDLIDIGQSTNEKPFNVLMTNSLSGNDVVPLPDGRELKQSPAASKANLSEAVASVLGGKGLVAGAKTKTTGRGKNKQEIEVPGTEYDAIFTTYSQMQPLKQQAPERAGLLRSISEKAFFILDESHNAGGGADSDPNQNQNRRDDGKAAVITRAEIVRGIISDAAGVYFSSATYAKRPQVMDLYAKTGMTVATKGDGAKLAEAIAKGGVPLQQVVSEMLVESGMYLRRERSFDGVEFDPKTVDVDLTNLDRVSGIFNAINEFDAFAQEAINAVRDDITSAGGAVKDTEATGQAGVESTSFSSILHNLVDQMLLAVKADAIADETIAAIKAGQSPVIYVDSTLEAALARQVDQLGASVGDVIDFSYRDLVRRYLERSREYTIRGDVDDPDSVERIRLSDVELGPEGVAAYERCAEMIDSFSADMPASPIDWIRKRIADAGYSIGEITGRQIILEYGSDDLVRLGKRAEDEAGAGGRTMTVAKFNDGSIDAVLINQSGSTGISMHASSKFANQKPRHMIIGQPARNIDTFMQSLGRIHRTGQVVLPRFTLMMTNAPAENRPAGVLVKKLASLNANVTASSKGAVSFDVPDVINVLGDQAVAEYLADNPELDKRLGKLVQLRADGSPKKNYGIAKRASGRMALRPVAEQQQFWESVVDAYNEIADELNRIGKNPLVAATLDLKAKTLDSTTLFEGDTTSANVFSQPAMIETIRAVKPGKPMTADEVRAKVTDFYGKEPTKDVATKWADGIASELRDAYKAYESQFLENVPEEERQERRSELVELAKDQYSKLMGKLRKFAPGTSVSVYDRNSDGTVQEVTPGFVVGIKKRKGSEKGNPLAASKWSIEIAIGSPDRVARTLVSRLGEIKNEDSQEGYREFLSNDELLNEQSLKEFAEADSSPTELRYVGVGNVLAAFSELSSAGGQVTFFTDAEGNPRRGVLMPRKFKIDQWQKDKPVRFERADHVLTFMDQGGRINTPDGQLELITLRGELVLRAPSSKQKGGKYTLNKKILAASKPEEFVKKGARSEMIVSDRRQQIAVVNAVLEMSGLQANGDKDLARSIIDGSAQGPSEFNPTRRLGSQRESNLANKRGDDTDAKVRFNTQTPNAPVRSSSDDKAGIAAADVVKTISRIFNMTTRIGSIRGRALGTYLGLSSRQNVPRTERLAEEAATSIAVHLHETGHHIDRLHNIVSNNPDARALVSGRDPRFHVAREELRSLDYLAEGRPEEGFAEWVRIFLTEPETKDAQGNFVTGPMAKAPEFTKWMTTEYAKQNPELFKQLADAKAWVDKFADQSLIRRLRAQISNSPGDDLEFQERMRKRLKDSMRSVRTGLLDRHDGWNQIDKAYREAGGQGPLGRDVVNVYEYSASVHAERAMEDGVHNIATGAVIGNRSGLWPRVRKLLKSDQELADAELFAYARHTVWAEQNRPGYFTGMNPRDAEKLLERVQMDNPDQYQRFEKIAVTISEVAHDLLKMRVLAGTFSRKDYDTIIDMYGDNYFPMMRAMDGQRTIKGNGSGYLNVPVGVPGRSRKGSGRPVMSPFESLHKMAHDYYSVAARGRVQEHLRSMIDPRFGGAEGMGWVGTPIDPKLKKSTVIVTRILDQLVSRGLVERDDANAAVTAGQILGRVEGYPSDDELQEFADRHGIDVNDQQAMDYAAMQEPSVEGFLSQWDSAYEPEPGKMIAISYDRQGNPYLHEYDAEIYKMLTDLSPPHLALSSKLISKMGRGFKSAAVSANATFALLNIFRDYVTYQGRAKNVKGIKTLTEPIKQLVRYGNYKRRSMLGRSRDRQASDLLLFDSAGGSTFSRAGMDASSRKREVRRLLSKSRLGKLGFTSKHPRDIAAGFVNTSRYFRDAVENVISISDAPPRLAEMNAVIRSHGFTPLTGGKFRNENTGNVRDGLPEDVMIEAMMAAANATVNFKKGGTVTKAIDVYVPFAMATINANATFAKQVVNLRHFGRSTPEGKLANRYAAYLATTAAMAAIYYSLRRDDDDYKNAEDWELNKYWTFGWGGVTYVRVPKPQDEAILSNAVESIMGDVFGDADTRDILGVVTDDMIGRVPTGGGPVKGLGEIVLNYDFYRGRDIEPEFVQDYSTRNQYTNDTRYLSILVGKVTANLGMSPMQVEHLINATTANQYEKMHRLFEGWNSGSLSFENVPGARAFYVNRHASRPISDFYDRLGELKTAVADASKDNTGDDPRIIEAKSEMAKLDAYRAIMAAVTEAQRTEPGDKYKYVPYVVGLAREALGYDSIDSSPSPLGMATEKLPAGINAAIAEFAKKATDSTLLMHGVPEKVPKDEEGKKTFGEVRRVYRDRIDSRLTFLEEHQQDPAFATEIRKIVRSKQFNEAMRREPSRGELTSQEFRDDLIRHRQQRSRVMAIARSQSRTMATR